MAVVSVEYHEAKGKLIRDWAKHDKERTLAQIANTVNLAEETIWLRLEMDKLRKHTEIGIFYVHRLREKLNRAEAMIRELRRQVRQLEGRR